MARLIGLRRKIHRKLGRPDGALGIYLLGHREYVGGMWEAIGKLQFDFLLSRGLEPEHVFLDVACGPLRLGVRLIPYLNRGNYLGIEKEERLVRMGIAKELEPELYASKAPELVISSSFEFEKFSRKPDFAIAQSLFTHLREEDIALCLTKLRQCANPGSRFFATYFVGGEQRSPGESNACHQFIYTREQADGFGRAHGWKPNYIGGWDHPRNQIMVEYVAE
ncbi:MAG: class I SAM-dependent methyltransferase [Candidatus Binataceae bacterium]|jgi:SAM-dependent methyltransferase